MGIKKIKALLLNTSLTTLSIIFGVGLFSASAAIIPELLAVDEIIYYLDADGDGFGNPSSELATTSTSGIVDGYSEFKTDCNDGDPSINLDAEEVCNAVDDNCDGEVDEGVKTVYYADEDGDNFGDAGNTVEACEIPDGYVIDNTDCDDSASTTNPGVEEIEDDGVDNNCNGTIDEDDSMKEPKEHSYYHNHGAHMSEIARYTNELKRQGEITGREKGAMMKEMAHLNGQFKKTE